MEPRLKRNDRYVIDSLAYDGELATLICITRFLSFKLNSDDETTEHQTPQNASNEHEGFKDEEVTEKALPLVAHWQR